ncbi:MAG: zeta toxin family protein [Eubacterium sp.]|nr:zeta toxin family protein [Eubacterium sp.]
MEIFKLTGKPVSEDLQNVLQRLEKGIYVPIDDIEDTPELKLARSCINNSIATDKLTGRGELQEYVLEQLQKRGSAVIDSNGRVQYNGNISNDSRLDIVIGLPGAGKSSSIVDVISNEFHSQIIDNDEAKKLIPEYNNGWGASVVHKEAQQISEKQLVLALYKHENIVFPKVGSDPDKMNRVIKQAKVLGYEVNVHFVDLERGKALGRMLSRFIEEGRFLDPNLIDKYNNNIDGDKIARCYEILKKGGNIDGYSKWSNDVEKGEKPILIEAECRGEFIRNARTAQHRTADNIRDAGGVGSGRSGSIPRYIGQSRFVENTIKQRNVAKDSGNSQTGRGRNADAKASIRKKLEHYRNEVDKQRVNRIDRVNEKNHGNRRPER